MASPAPLDKFPSTKFAAPRGAPEPWRQSVVSRLFGAGADRPVVVVRGLPGSGKRDLVSRWLEAPDAGSTPGHRVAWISCDEADTDSATLWAAVDVGVRRAVGDQPQLRFDPTDPDDAATVIIERIDRSGPLTIVVDGAHRAGDAVATLQPLVDWVPSGSQLVFITARTLPLTMQRLRLRRAVHEVTPADLALRPEELTSLLTARGVEIEGSDVDLMDRFGGWQIMATKMASTAPDGDDLGLLSVSGAIPAEVRHLIRDEVLADTDDIDLHILADLAELDAFSRTDARSVVSSDRVDDALDLAEDRCCVWVESDGLYQFHSVISRYLRAERVGLEESHHADVHERAARRFSQTGQVGAAIRHRLAADDVDGAIRELSASRVMWGTGTPDGRTVVVDWIGQVDPIRLRSHGTAESMARYALALAITGEYESTMRWLRACGELSRSNAEVHGNLVSAELMIAMHTGSVAEARTARDELVELRGSWSWPAAVLAAMIEVSTWIDDNATARALCELVDTEVTLTSEDELPIAAAYAFNLAVAGHLHDANQLAAATLAAAERDRVRNHLVVVPAQQARAIVDFERGRFAAARRRLAAVIDRVGDQRPAVALLSRAALAEACIAAGDLDAAANTLTVLRPPESTGSPLMDHVTSAAAHLAVARGDFDRARHLAAQMVEPWRGDLWRRRVAIRGSHVDDGGPRAADGQVPATPRRLIEDAVLNAAVAMRNRDHATAEHHLRLALELAIDEEWVRPFFEFDLLLWPSVRALLLEWPHRRFHDEAERVAQSMHTEGASAARHQAGDRLGQLLPREREVLDLLARELSTREIAEVLYVSANTVKTHIRAIYGKLDVHSRVELLALIRSHEMTGQVDGG